MKTTSIPTALLILALAHGVFGDDRLDKLTPEHRKWLEEEVNYIITDQERDVFLSLQTVEERERFIEAFWDRRDPDPLTAVNEFKEEHYKRLAYANRTFSRDAPRPGWKTDRGKFYIILGKPQEVQRFDGLNDVVASELWIYNGDTKYGLPPRFNLLFYKENDVGDYELYHPLGDGPEALLRGGMGFYRNYQNAAVDILETVSMELAKASLTVDLTEPVGDFLAGRNSRQPLTSRVRPPINVENVIANIEQSPQRRFKANYLDAYLKYKDKVSADYSFRFVPSHQYYAVFYGPEDTPFLHYGIELDPENFSLQADEDGTKFYTTVDITVEARDSAGNLVATAENSPYIELSLSQMQAVAGLPVDFQDALPLLPGDYNISLIFKNRATKQFTAAERELRIRPVPTGPALGAMILAHKAEITQSGGPIVFRAGDEILYPSVGASFTTNEVAYVYAQVWKAPSDHRVHLSLLQGEEKVLDKDVAVEPGDSGIVEELPLVGLESGDYKVRVELLDPSSNIVADRTEKLSISPRTSIARAGFVYRHGFNADVPGLLDLVRGQQWMAMGRLGEAETSFRKAVEAKNPGLIMARWKLATVLLYSKRTDEALSLLLPLEQDHGSEPDVVDGLGLSYYMKGDFEKAVGYLEKSLTLRPPQSPLLNALADAYQNLGQVDKAKTFFERSLELNPAQEAVKQRLASLAKSP